MEEDKEESSKKKLRQDNPLATAASLLTDDLILEILSRLPAISVSRFKCVSVSWRDLIADPVNRKKLPQTLAGFLYTVPIADGPWSHHFASVPGGAAPVDPYLPFLQPDRYKHIYHVDIVNGLLLCACFSKKPDLLLNVNDASHYVVCNPATGWWIELPPQPLSRVNRIYSAPRLAFDPAVSSHFHVVEICETFVDFERYVTGVDIFSSQTGAWIHRDNRVVEEFTVLSWVRSVFFGGMLHLVGEANPRKEHALLVVDMEGKAWKTIRLPDQSSCETIDLSQGCLYYATTTQAHVSNSHTENAVVEIKLWCLENYDREEWVLKHSASIDEPLSITERECRVFAIHPDCDTVFLDRCGRDMLAAYDMQHQKFSYILNIEKGNLREYLPYVPLFTEVLAVADGQ